MTTFNSGQDITYSGKSFTVVRGHPDSDGDIVVKDPSTGLEQYAKASKCIPSAQVAPKAPEAVTPEPIYTPEPVAQPKQGNQTMSNAQNSSRRTVTVTLIDQDVNLEGKDAIVLELGQQITEGSTQELIQELIMDPANKVAEALKAHNDKRANVVNREVLNRTGNKVKLEPVKMRELNWDIR